VTIDGQSGTGFDTDSFTITNAAVTFAAADAFQGAFVQLIGPIGRVVAAQGTVNSFDVSGWSGTGKLTAPAGTGTVTASKSAGYTLTNSSLSSTDGMVLSLVGINSANLTDTAGGNSFAVGGWTGTGSLIDSASTTDTVRASKNVGYTVSNGALSSPDGMALTLSGFAEVRLTDTAGGHMFTVSGWTGTGVLTDSAAATDTVDATKQAGFTLANAALSSTDGMALSLSGFTKANLTDTAGGNTFTVSSWTGTGTLIDSAAAADTITARKQAGYTLANAALSSTDGMALSLTGIATANLTDTGGGNTFTVSG
jgi:hypothetical protein